MYKSGTPGSIRKRTVLISVMLILILFLLLFRIAVLVSGQFSQAAERQAGAVITVANSRGTIYDSLLRPIVNAGSEMRAAAIPTPEAVSLLGKHTAASVMEQLTARIQEGKPIVAAVDEKFISADGMEIFTVPVRYETPIIAPHVIGYLDNTGIQGVTGAELIFNDILNAAAGKASVTFTIDAAGRALQGIKPAVDNTLGNSAAGVALTIDRDIQLIAEKAAKANISKGAVVVMDAATGHISALVSLPDYQPNTVADVLSDDNSPLLNRALCNYNLGSVFKIVTAAAALEAGIPTSTVYECTGSASVGNIVFHCSHRIGHGKHNLFGGFSVSCNPYFIRIAQRTGGQALYQQAVLLGFDRPVYLAEGWKTARAVLPSEAELLSPAAVANLSFGQGLLMATPVHIAQLVSAVVNDGEMVRPTLFKGTVDAAGKLTPVETTPTTKVFSESTAATLREMMVLVTEEGTGKAARPAEGGAGGKTGTAETGVVEDGRSIVQGWFAGFYPAKNPETIIVVIAEDTKGEGGKASPVFKEIASEISMLKKERAMRQG